MERNVLLAGNKMSQWKVSEQLSQLEDMVKIMSLVSFF